MMVLGLTGSIGMGKSTVASMFGDLGIPVNDADAVVHRLYGGEAAPLIEDAFPGSTKDGKVDRSVLAGQLAEKPILFRTLEKIVHPLVRAAERAFLEEQKLKKAWLVLLDIPLLFETRGEDRVDAVVVVTCDPLIQRERVLKRPGMTEEKLALILSRQIPDEEKRGKADYIIDTGGTFDSVREQVSQLVARLREP